VPLLPIVLLIFYPEDEFILFLGVVCKLRHTKNYFFDPLFPLWNVTHSSTALPIKALWATGYCKIHLTLLEKEGVGIKTPTSLKIVRVMMT